MHSIRVIIMLLLVLQILYQLSELHLGHQTILARIVYIIIKIVSG